MRVDGLRVRPRRRFRLTTQSDPHAAWAPNVLQPRFAAAAPNRVWPADITAIATAEGWLYRAVLLDLYSRRVVGWALRSTLETDLVTAAWAMAVAQRHPPPGLMHHSDRGCQYTSDRYPRVLRQAGAQCSMSRRGNCFDNAPTESLFRTFKVELAAESPWPRQSAATRAIAADIEQFYTRERLHSRLGPSVARPFEQQAIVA